MLIAVNIGHILYLKQNIKPINLSQLILLNIKLWVHVILLSLYYQKFNIETSIFLNFLQNK